MRSTQISLQKITLKQPSVKGSSTRKSFKSKVNVHVFQSSFTLINWKISLVIFYIFGNLKRVQCKQLYSRQMSLFCVGQFNIDLIQFNNCRCCKGTGIIHATVARNHQKRRKKTLGETQLSRELRSRQSKLKTRMLLRFFYKIMYQNKLVYPHFKDEL